MRLGRPIHLANKMFSLEHLYVCVYLQCSNVMFTSNQKCLTCTHVHMQLNKKPIHSNSQNHQLLPSSQWNRYKKIQRRNAAKINKTTRIQKSKSAKKMYQPNSLYNPQLFSYTRFFVSHLTRCSHSLRICERFFDLNSAHTRTHNVKARKKMLSAVFICL